MNTKKVLVWVLVGVLLVAGLVFPRGNPVVQRVVGAVPTLDGVDNPFVSINGLRTYYYRQGMVATSSVICSIKNPFNATSTLVSYTAQITSKGNIAQQQLIDISTSTTALASSTPAFLRDVKLGGSQGYIRYVADATTTNATLVGRSNVLASSTDAIVAPGEFVNLRIATTSPGTFTTYWTGSCQAEFRKF